MLAPEIPHIQALRPVPPAPDDLPLAPELFRQILVSLDLPKTDIAPVIGITSAISGEGRTTIALGLARTLAADLDAPILLVEVDLDRPSLASHFGLPPAPGLSEVLRGECRFGDATHAVGAGLSVVTTGAGGRDAARLLRQLPILDPFHGMPHDVGAVVLDLPPIINHSYSPLAASVADELVLVVRAGITPVEMIREAIARLEDRPPKGVVLNAPKTSVPAWFPGQGVQ